MAILLLLLLLLSLFFLALLLWSVVIILSAYHWRSVWKPECGENETFRANPPSINEFKIYQESNVLNENTFVATVLVNVCDDQKIETFLTEFKEISNTDYNKNKADTKEGKSVKVSGRRKCIHNVQKKGKQGDQGSEKWNEY